MSTVTGDLNYSAAEPEMIIALSTFEDCTLFYPPSDRLGAVRIRGGHSIEGMITTNPYSTANGAASRYV